MLSLILVKFFIDMTLKIFWETLEAGAKKWIFSPFWSLWSQNLGTSEQEKAEQGRIHSQYQSRMGGQGGNASLPTFQLDHYDGRTNRWTDKASYRVASLRLKIGKQTKLLLKS